MKKILLKVFTAVSILSASVLFSCKFGFPTMDEEASVNGRWDSISSAFTDLGELLSQNESEYTFLVFTDIHYGKEGFPVTEELLKFIDNYNFNHSSNPLAFVLYLGDSADTGSKSEFLGFSGLEKQIMEKIKTGIDAAPPKDSSSDIRKTNIFCSLGNHDILNGGYSDWKAFHYPHKPGYKFTVTAKNSSGQSVTRSFYGADSASAAFGANQYNFLKNAFSSDTNKKFFISHEPMHQMGEENPFTSLLVSFEQKDRLLMTQLLLENEIKLYFSGHTHAGGTYDWGEYAEFCCKSYTEKHGMHCFYTATVNEDTKRITINRYENINWSDGPSKVFSYNID